MKNLHSLIVLFSFSLLLISCDGGPKVNDTGNSDGNTNSGALVASAENGKIYYDRNCKNCHAAGNSDPTSAFTAKDLKLIDPDTRIMADMSGYDSVNKMMTRFKALDPQRVLDLKAYLKSN